MFEFITDLLIKSFQGIQYKGSVSNTLLSCYMMYLSCYMMYLSWNSSPSPGIVLLMVAIDISL